MKNFNLKLKSTFMLLFTLLIVYSNTLLGWADSGLVKRSEAYYVNDAANVLSKELEDYIVGVNKSFENTSEKPQVVVTTIPDLNGYTIEEYSYKLFEKYKIGNKDYDNGILLLLAPNDREIRLEIGYGLEGAITDTKSGQILDLATEKYLSNDDMDSGVELIFNTVCNEISSEYKYDNSVFEVSEDGKLITFTGDSSDNKMTSTKATILFVVIIGLVYLDLRFNKGRLTEILFFIMDLLSCFGGSGKGGSSRSSGGGGRSGGGGSSRRY